MKIVKNALLHAQSIDVHCHYIREQETKKEIDSIYYPIKEHTNILTKPLGKDKFERLKSALGLVLNEMIIRWLIQDINIFSFTLVML